MFQAKVYLGDCGGKDTPPGGTYTKNLSHISRNATGLQLQLKGRAGRSLDIVKRKSGSEDFRLPFEIQNIIEFNNV